MAKSIMTMDLELQHLREAVRETQQENRLLREDVRGIMQGLSDLSQRTVRLETQRDADRAQMEAEVARFKAEVLQAEARLSRLLPPPLLPPPQTPEE